MRLGSLPKSLDVKGKSYRIRSDYRNILEIFVAFADENLTDADKLYVLMRRLFVDFDKIPRDDYAEAYKAACDFIQCGHEPEKGSPHVLDWIHDEPIIFPAVNKVAGVEVRGLAYLHWWTFMGYFQSVDGEDLLSTVLSIRQKKARGKKLEKWEQDFYRNNKNLCSFNAKRGTDVHASVANDAASIFDQLIQAGGE